ncbi:tRNA (adenine(22)-N(1))-methyltransferase [Blautia sp. MSJ-19]|uniref:tRNA (adenine(22)-N(1))-methyltransferase n=1 Tax=Blautia sp. MSJ-19 TaxID=2841517 RepID=UPI001C0EC9C5|nr:class I SAM-dependent methyltransferase [Blautia sp. MSJ-19]MBU5482401.1 class I SAM-dependent methyltransferase [Blautia sp. MSJ-19]
MAGSVQLSRRLLTIAGMVTEGNRLVDVGCDHGYLPVYLMMQHRIPGAIATDVGKGPLARAQEHIAQYGLEQYIETRLCDGLAGVAKEEGDTLVIAGMGGPLMEKILAQGENVIGGFQEMILQPQSDVPHFRHFLMTHGFRIVQEEMVLEEGKYYPMMKAVPGKEEAWTVEEEMFGKLLLAQLHPVLHKYLKRELRIREQIEEQLKGASGEGAQKRLDEIKEERQLILAALHRYESKGTD